MHLHRYAPVRDAIGAGAPNAPAHMKFLAGAITGAVGSIAGNPFDVLKTLAQTNKSESLPLMQLVGQMYRDQGVGGFYRGVEVNIMRAITLNATKMGVYDISKGYVVDSTGWARNSVKTAFCSSFLAGFFMTVVSSYFAVYNCAPPDHYFLMAHVLIYSPFFYLDRPWLLLIVFARI